MRASILTASLVALLIAVTAAAPQKPVPFPRPTEPPPAGPPPAKPSDPPAPAVALPAPDTQAATAPTEEMLGAPIYPGSLYITSYDAGRGQRFYLFGTNTDFAQIVTYYRNVMRSRGDEVFREPPVHMFDLARFRAETMAFPPSVTVKDYAWGSSQGYLNPTPGAEPARFRTIIQIVPLPPGVSGR
jgi:hypothetical protein